MKVFRSADFYIPSERTVATMGTFDGLHKGHIFVLQSLNNLAKSQNADSLVITLFPHPRVILQPEANPAFSIYSLEEKTEALFNLGIDKLLILPFDKSFAQMSSVNFIDKILFQKLNIQHFIIGFDHHFGKNRSGGFEELKSFGKMEVTQLTAIQQNDQKISSTLIRTWIQSGQMRKVTQALGQPYSFSGTIIKGNQLGRTIGFPTANIQLDNMYKIIPANGVYYVDVEVCTKKYTGLMNIGNRPTVDGKLLSIEVHILNFDKEIYGEKIVVTCLDYIRAERKFDNLDELKQQISLDKSWALEHLTDFQKLN